METNLKFDSQICTTKIQSERLLDLGLKIETADMYYLNFGPIGLIPFMRDNKHHLEEDDIPAWSLHRLIQIMPQKIFYEDSTLILGAFDDGVYYADNEYGEVFKDFDGGLYECIIKCIDWLIKEGYINKEYLEEE